MFLSSTSNDAVLLVAGMMEMNLARRVHLEALRVRVGHEDARVELEQLVAAFDVFVDLGQTEGRSVPPTRSIDETLTELVSLPDRDVERIQRAAELIRDGLLSLPPDIGDELEAVGREWQAVRPDLVLIYELGSDDPLVARPRAGSRGASVSSSEPSGACRGRSAPDFRRSAADCCT